MVVRTSGTHARVPETSAVYCLGNSSPGAVPSDHRADQARCSPGLILRAQEIEGAGRRTSRGQSGPAHATTRLAIGYQRAAPVAWLPRDIREQPKTICATGADRKGCRRAE